MKNVDPTKEFEKGFYLGRILNNSTRTNMACQTIVCYLLDTNNKPTSISDVYEETGREYGKGTIISAAHLLMDCSLVERSAPTHTRMSTKWKLRLNPQSFETLKHYRKILGQHNED